MSKGLSFMESGKFIPVFTLKKVYLKTATAAGSTIWNVNDSVK